MELKLHEVIDSIFERKAALVKYGQDLPERDYCIEHRKLFCELIDAKRQAEHNFRNAEPGYVKQAVDDLNRVDERIDWIMSHIDGKGAVLI